MVLFPLSNRNTKFDCMGAFPKALVLLFLLVAFSVLSVSAQKKMTTVLPAGKTIKLQLVNREGTVTVEGWDRDQVQIVATVENSNTSFEPQVTQSTILINVIRDNQGKSGIGSVNFVVKVPIGSSVDIETMIGNLNIANVRGTLVRAVISAEGDITLTNVLAGNVTATNRIGDIFFDGDFRADGFYNFKSTSGNINLRVPLSSSFRFTATAPISRNIFMGSFVNAATNTINDGQRIVGRIREGAANLIVTNQRGTISFIAR
jgi:uncharacterized lipoprotein YajG